MRLIIIPTAWCCGRIETVIHELGALKATIRVGCGVLCLEVPAECPLHPGAAGGADRQETAQSEAGMCVCSSGTDP